MRCFQGWRVTPLLSSVLTLMRKCGTRSETCSFLLFLAKSLFHSSVQVPAYLIQILVTFCHPTTYFLHPLAWLLGHAQLGSALVQQRGLRRRCGSRGNKMGSWVKTAWCGLVVGLMGRRGWRLIRFRLEESGAEQGDKSEWKELYGKGGLKQGSVLLRRWHALPPLNHEALFAEAANESGKQQTKPEVADGCSVAALANFGTSSDSKECGCICVILKCAIWSISQLSRACRGGCGCVAHSSWALWLFSWRVSKTREPSRTRFQREECICCCLRNS